MPTGHTSKEEKVGNLRLVFAVRYVDNAHEAKEAHALPKTPSLTEILKEIYEMNRDRWGQV
jgi:hypothetical protein